MKLIHIKSSVHTNLIVFTDLELIIYYLPPFFGTGTIGEAHSLWVTYFLYSCAIIASTYSCFCFTELWLNIFSALQLCLTRCNCSLLMFKKPFNSNPSQEFCRNFSNGWKILRVAADYAWEHVGIIYTFTLLYPTIHINGSYYLPVQVQLLEPIRLGPLLDTTININLAAMLNMHRWFSQYMHLLSCVGPQNSANMDIREQTFHCGIRNYWHGRQLLYPLS